MSDVIRKIPLEQLTPHPDNPNRMSEETFKKLVRNIGQTGRYEPLIVRRTTHIHGDIGENSSKPRRNTHKNGAYQIINGHHRWLALKKLGWKTADAIVWDVDDAQADVLLATLNRLCGRDVLDKKVDLLKRLSVKAKPAELAKLLPQTKPQLEKLTSLRLSRVSSIRNRAPGFSNPLVFFVSDDQKKIVEAAIDSFIEHRVSKIQNRAAKRASALACICKFYLRRKASCGDHKSGPRHCLLQS